MSSGNGKGGQTSGKEGGKDTSGNTEFYKPTTWISYWACSSFIKQQIQLFWGVFDSFYHCAIGKVSQRVKRLEQLFVGALDLFPFDSRSSSTYFGTFFNRRSKLHGNVEGEERVAVWA